MLPPQTRIKPSFPDRIQYNNIFRFYAEETVWKVFEVTSKSPIRRIFYFYEFYSRRNTHIMVAKTESGRDYTHISVAERGTFIKVEFRASLGVKRSTLMWIRLSRQNA